MRFSTAATAAITTAAALGLWLACIPAARAEDGRPGAPGTPGTTDYSPAERLLFMTPQLKGLQAPTLLRYGFSETGSLEAGFTDKVVVALSARADGSCCDAKGSFLNGTHKEEVPDVPDAVENPVLLYFLEHDVREMKRLTGGSENYFRKRLRMAIYQQAKVHDVTLRYQGHEVRGQEIVFSPFLDDPNRPKFEKFAKKNYRFQLSNEVPGCVYGIRTEIPGADAAGAPLIAEELLIAGAKAPA